MAKTASMADVAATLIAGAVDLPEHPLIHRAPAKDIRDDTDLGDQLVVRNVGALTATEVGLALDAGARRAVNMQNQRLIHAASLHLRGQSRQIELNKEIQERNEISKSVKFQYELAVKKIIQQLRIE